MSGLNREGFNQWWNSDELSKDNSYERDTPAFWAWEGWQAGVAAEREKVAKWMIECGYATGHGDTIEDLLGELNWQIRESEREACAKLCDYLDDDLPDGLAGWQYGVAIRERGLTKLNQAAEDNGEPL